MPARDDLNLRLIKKIFISICKTYEISKCIKINFAPSIALVALIWIFVYTLDWK